MTSPSIFAEFDPIPISVIPFFRLQSLPSRAALRVETETAAPMPPSKKKKSTPNDTSVKPEALKRMLTDEEKAKLTMELEALMDAEIEVDLEAFSDDTLFALWKLLDDHLLEKQKRQVKAEPCEMEILNESGFSNSSMQPCKARIVMTCMYPGNDRGDEEVDIVGGNDAPISSFPPVEIEKDPSHRNSKCSSSSSSSSESGSSSSDSDSGSSSESESDDAKVPASFGGGKELDFINEAKNSEKCLENFQKLSTHIAAYVPSSSLSEEPCAPRNLSV
ncbi:unnamed protein product [Prunus armeniaca]|uniref:NET domain-containing protein n=1 Tax=Prunus armeniaca TaxID=36596 RepID=A0A6J5UX78_PRUAR|nr:unnamed protein product [Prunus armeniaca]